jgi:hypothetical protein
MPASDRRYCVLAVEYADKPGVPEILAAEGKVVLIDTLTMAKDVCERFGAGRQVFPSLDGETYHFSPLSIRGYNKICIWTGYDPYDVPSGIMRLGIRSEAEGRDWRWHCHWMGQVYCPNLSKDVLVLDVLLAEAERSATDAFGESDLVAV